VTTETVVGGRAREGIETGAPGKEEEERDEGSAKWERRRRNG
jgi:hypothetical protein